MVCAQFLVSIAACLAVLFSAFFTYKSVNALYVLQKVEIDLSLREERAEYFEEISNILHGIFQGIESYMASRNYDFYSEEKKIKILERKAKYSLDSQDQKTFSEIIDFIDNVIENYRIFYNKRSSEREPYPIPEEQHVLQSKSIQHLEKLENKYLFIDNIYPYKKRFKYLWNQYFKN